MINILKDLYPDSLLTRYRIDLAPRRHYHTMDSRELYQSNLKTQPLDWYYRTHAVTYNLNSNGYRCPEWTDIDWPASWIIVGCSYVEGIGLDEVDTISTRLSELIGDPVINLGVSGSAPDAHLLNTIRLIDSDIRPKGVIYLNSERFFNRVSVFTDQRVVSLGPWVGAPAPWAFDNSPENINLYASWVQNTHNADTHSYICSRGLVSMWESKHIPIYYFNIDQDLTAMIDRARDLLHPGRETVKLWAQEILDKILQSKEKARSGPFPTSNSN